MSRLFPELIKEELSPTHWVYKFKLDAALKWYEGHFEKRQLFPGVAQLFYVDVLSKELISANLGYGAYRLSGLSQFKFCCPIMPNDDVTLDMDLDLTKKRLRYKIYKQGQNGPIVAADGVWELSKLS